MLAACTQLRKDLSFIHTTGRVPQGTVKVLIWPLPGNTEPGEGVRGQSVA
jgi:hypothetical protein